jgi:DNA mismatch endonuclease (patch repair protein)
VDSKTAKKIRSKDTQIEVLLGKAMWAKGLRYRKNCKDLFGKLDFF